MSRTPACQTKLIVSRHLKIGNGQPWAGRRRQNTTASSANEPTHGQWARLFRCTLLTQERYCAPRKLGDSSQFYRGCSRGCMVTLPTGIFSKSERERTEFPVETYIQISMQQQYMFSPDFPFLAGSLYPHRHTCGWLCPATQPATSPAPGPIPAPAAASNSKRVGRLRQEEALLQGP